MLIKNFYITFLFSLILGSLTAASSNSWFVCWLGLEINFISIIPLILYKINFNSTEASIKYFLPQALASVLIIFSAIWTSSFHPQSQILYFNTVIIAAISLKIGIAPFHFWFPQVILRIDWFNALIMFTWQKIAPFVLIYYFLNRKLILILICASATIGCLGGLNQNNIKVLLAYSSIAHSRWILLSLNFLLPLWGFYFTSYSLITTSIVTPCTIFNISSIKEIRVLKEFNSLKILIAFNIINLGGLPPFLGFSIKISVIIPAIKTAPLLLITLLLASSLVSLFFYGKIIFNNIITNSLRFINKKTIGPQTFGITLITALSNIIAPWAPSLLT